jgi:hypothetical protein
MRVETCHDQYNCWHQSLHGSQSVPVTTADRKHIVSSLRMFHPSILPSSHVKRIQGHIWVNEMNSREIWCCDFSCNKKMDWPLYLWLLHNCTSIIHHKAKTWLQISQKHCVSRRSSSLFFHRLLTLAQVSYSRAASTRLWKSDILQQKDRKRHSEVNCTAAREEKRDIV